MSNRRQFLQTALASSALLLTGPKLAAAAICTRSPEQTKGPFIPDDFPFRDAIEGHPYINAPEKDADLTRIGAGPAARGQAIYLRGRIVDGDCRPVPGAKVFLWQADEQGHYNHSEDPNINEAASPSALLDPNFQYRGIVSTDRDGLFQFRTIKPKYYPLDPSNPSFKRTAHIHLGIMKEGYESLFTQAYFEGDLLEDIGEIRRLNKIDILLGEWRQNRPVGRINPVYLPLIASYREERGFDAPVGEIRLAIREIAS